MVSEVMSTTTIIITEFSHYYDEIKFKFFVCLNAYASIFLIINFFCKKENIITTTQNRECILTLKLIHFSFHMKMFANFNNTFY